MKKFLLVLLSALALQGCGTVVDLMTHHPEVTYFTPESADKFIAEATAITKGKGYYRSAYMSRLTELLFDGTNWTCNSRPYLITVDGLALDPPIGNNVEGTAVSVGGCQQKVTFAKLKGKFDGEFIYLRVADSTRTSIYKYKPIFRREAGGSSYELTWVGTIRLEDGVPKLIPTPFVESGKFGTWNYGQPRDSHERTFYKSEPYMKEPGSISDLVKSMNQDYEWAVNYNAKNSASWATDAAKIKASNAQAAREIDADTANFMRNKSNEMNRAASTLNKITVPAEPVSSRASGSYIRLDNEKSSTAAASNASSSSSELPPPKPDAKTFVSKCFLALNENGNDGAQSAAAKRSNERNRAAGLSECVYEKRIGPASGVSK